MGRLSVAVRVAFVVLCLLIPIVWGVLVNWVFDRLQAQLPEKEEQETVFPDFQI